MYHSFFLYRYSGDYSIKSDEISFRLMAALRLLALEGTTEPGFSRRVMDWHDVVMGQTDLISTDNERKALIMLQDICKKADKHAKHEIAVLSVKKKVHYYSMSLMYL